VENPQARFAGICKSERFPKEEDYVRPHLVIKLERIHSVLFSFFSPIFYFAAVSQVLMAFAIRSNSLYASCSDRPLAHTHLRKERMYIVHIFATLLWYFKNSPRKSQFYWICREVAELMGTFFDVVAIRDLCSLMERTKGKAKRALRTIYVLIITT